MKADMKILRIIIIILFLIAFIGYAVSSFLFTNDEKAPISEQAPAESSVFSKDCSSNLKEFTVLSICDGDTIVIGELMSQRAEEPMIDEKDHHRSNVGGPQYLGDEINYLRTKHKLCSRKTNLENISAESSELEAIYKIRLLGIDAFEMGQIPHGKESKDFLRDLLLDKTVCIETDVNEKDIYERTLGYVFLDTAFVNEQILKNGYTVLYNFPPNVKYIDELKKAQAQARENMLGIWEEQDYITETPAQYRKRNR